MNKFGERLKELRKKKGLSVVEAARGIGVSVQTYRRYECGKGNCTSDILVRMVEFFEMTAGYLIGLED